ncbi:hypothetical protein P692DRAFT_20867853 [Suillus brevipes Sb2]|nr:hypothetical protein P692DRAFT_20867853 [Suillus brevipes Sb2]
MLTTLPAPVLSVTPDAVKDLQGQDALSALWTIFTKCKESLQDGRRLENISWRLWHRELILAQQSYLPPTPDSVSNIKVSSDTRSSFFSLTDPVKLVQPSGTPPCTYSTSIYQHPPSPASTTSPVVPERLAIPQFSSGTPVAPPLSTSFRPKSSSFVGRIIIDMLPNSVLIPDKMPSPCSLKPPTVPSVQLPSTPTSAQGYFPRVVVVNPTPQPTPPMTPSLSEEPTSASQPPSTFLLPPLPQPALIMKRQAHAEQPLPQSPPPDELLPSVVPARAAESSKVSGRFFLQQSPDDASPERDGSTESGKSRADLFDASSAASSQMHSTDNEKDVMKELKEKDRVTTKPKKAKELGRSSTRPPLAKRTHSARHIGPSIQRKHSNQDSKPRAMFNIGSNSSNGSKSANGSSAKLTPPPPPLAPVVNGLGAMLNGMTAINLKPARPTAAPVSAANGNTVVNTNGVSNAATNPSNGTGPQQRKTIVVASTSEEDYETTDADDSGWASEDMDAEDKAREAKETGLRGAALEAQRQRDLFAKVPKRSYSNLNRTQSGLLSQLMNPNPAIFPPNHPYRLSQSTADLVRMQRQAQRQAEQVQTPQRSASGFAGPVRLQTSKSSAALPLAAQITATSSSKPPSSGMKGKETEKGGYRPKGRPKEQEMEDESGEDDDDDDKIQVSRSVAQQRLQALMSRRAPGDGVAPKHTHTHVAENHAAPAAQSTAPIPLGHPYNLPAPAIPMTPRTTRRIMLRTELSESMRRQLLWERQVSSTTNPAANARRANNGVLGGLRPLASTTSMGENPSATKSAETQDRDERKRRAMARNRSWADDYHYSGW